MRLFKSHGAGGTKVPYKRMKKKENPDTFDRAGV